VAAASYAGGADVSFTAQIDADVYDVTTVDIVTVPSGLGWKAEADATGKITVTGKAPTTGAEVSYYFTATAKAGGAFRSPAETLEVTGNPDGSGGGDEASGFGSGSSGGCDAGFAGLALLLAAPLFLRKKD